MAVVNSSSGRRMHPLKVQGPVGERVPDGDGGYDQEFVTYAEPFGSIEPVTRFSRSDERFTLSGAIASASHLVTIPLLARMPQIQDRIFYGTRRFDVLAVDDTEERHIELALFCQEIKP